VSNDIDLVSCIPIMSKSYLRYDLDIIGIQETKICQFEDKKLPGNHRLLLFDQKTGRHGGLGFLMLVSIITSVHFIRSVIE
jgi:hypothetical protein